VIERLGILPGTFNPPTRAHLALARAALDYVDEVLFVLPRVFPHKGYQGATWEQRMEMLRRVIADEPRFAAAGTGRGLFVEIARECRLTHGDVALRFICGRDAAERIVNWDYGHPDAFPAMLDQFELLVAARGGDYCPPAELAARIHPLPLDRAYAEVSATEVRERIARGAAWEELVPPPIVPLVRRIYLPAGGFPAE